MTLSYLNGGKSSRTYLFALLGPAPSSPFLPWCVSVAPIHHSIFLVVMNSKKGISICKYWYHFVSSGLTRVSNYFTYTPANIYKAYSLLHLNFIHTKYISSFTCKFHTQQHIRFGHLTRSFLPTNMFKAHSFLHMHLIHKNKHIHSISWAMVFGFPPMPHTSPFNL